MQIHPWNEGAPSNLDLWSVAIFGQDACLIRTLQLVPWVAGLEGIQLFKHRSANASNGYLLFLNIARLNFRIHISIGLLLLKISSGTSPYLVPLIHTHPNILIRGVAPHGKIFNELPLILPSLGAPVQMSWLEGWPPTVNFSMNSL